jgi:hypothetical protein
LFLSCLVPTLTNSDFNIWCLRLPSLSSSLISSMSTVLLVLPGSNEVIYRKSRIPLHVVTLTGNGGVDACLAIGGLGLDVS